MSDGDAKNPQLDMENMRAAWSYATTERERAKLEGQMWALVPREDRQALHHGRAQWVSHTFQVTAFEAAGRSALDFAGEEAEELWRRVDGPDRMLVSSARQVLIAARQRAVTSGVGLADAIAAELRIYDTWPLHRTARGTFRRAPPRFRRGSLLNAEGPVKTVRGKKETRERFAALRIALRRAVEFEMEHIDSGTRETLIGQMEVEMSAMLDSMSARIRRVVSGAQASSTAMPDGMTSSGNSRKALRAACVLLGIDAPAVNDHVDFVAYKTAKKTFRSLVREYHPDVSTAPHARERYQEVVDAMQTIEQDHQARDADRGADNELAGSATTTTE